ncbi:hypothetical protein B7463_g2827, partial [Scytalidium lignicola]
MGNNSQDLAKVLTIGISGCSSSGKTTLTQLLNEIFSDISFITPRPSTNYNSNGSEEKKKELKLSSSGNSELDDEEAEIGGSLKFQETELNNGENNITMKTVVIHQDSFFVPKPECPNVTFELLGDDQAYLLLSETERSPEISRNSPSSIQRLDEIGIHEQKAKSTHKILEIDIEYGKTYQLNNNISKSSRDKPCKKQQQTYSESQHLTTSFITSPNTDCISALDMISFRKTISLALETGSVPPASTFPSPRLGSPTIAWINTLKTDYKLLIQKQRMRVSDWVSSLSPTITLPQTLCFIEGFLLYLPYIQVPPGTEINGNIKEQYAAAREVFDMIDLKLFLQIERNEAKARRFRRPEYCDPSVGGTRKVGQLWKTEGYFESVVWKEHLDNLNRLRSEEGPSWRFLCWRSERWEGCSERRKDENLESFTPQQQHAMTVEEVVESAVGLILHYLERSTIGVTNEGYVQQNGARNREVIGRRDIVCLGKN